MNAIFFCYSDKTSTLDKFLDQILLFSVVGFSVLVFLDWTYWKTAPYALHSLMLHGIVFTLLFIRFCQSLDIKRVLSEPTYPPRMITALLSGVNGVILTFSFVGCRNNYPDFLRLPYFILAIVILVFSYAQILYLVYGLISKFGGGSSDSRMKHHQMEDEDDFANKDGPIKGHLKEQKNTSKNGGNFK